MSDELPPVKLSPLGEAREAFTNYVNALPISDEQKHRLKELCACCEHTMRDLTKTEMILKNGIRR